MSEPQQDDPWKALRRTNTVYGDYYDADRADDAKAHMEARHAEELATLRARADEYEARVKQDHDEIVELTAEIMTLRAQLAAGRQEIEAALKQLMADAFAAKLTATDAADVAYVAGLQKGIDLLAALASPSTPEPQTCEWRNLPLTRGVMMADCQGEAFDYAVPATWAKEFKVCPYCGKPLALSPDQPTEAQ